MLKKSAEKVEPTTTAESPTSAAEFSGRGWSHYSKKEYFRAEADFRKALEFSPDSPEYLYNLAMSLQASGRPKEAVEVFEEAIQLMENPGDAYRVRYLMMTRLAKGHINRIRTGDWNLDIR